MGGAHAAPRGTRASGLFWWAFGLLQGIFLLWTVTAATIPLEPSMKEDGFTQAVAVWTTFVAWAATDLVIMAGYTLRKVIKK